MIFHHDFFSPELIADAPLRQVLCTAVERGHRPVQPADIVAAAIQHGREDILRTLSQVLPPGVALEEILHAIEADRAPSGGRQDERLSRQSFAPPLLQALDEFQAILRGSGGVLDPVALQLLLFCVLGPMEEQQRRRLRPLDVQRAATLFREQVAQVMEPPSPDSRKSSPLQEPPPSADDPFRLPPQLASSEDLTQQARSATDDLPFPFDGEPAYDRLFDSIARVLHRRRVNHVLLTGERGVGKTTILSELARRAVVGRMPFLGNRRFIRVDCRYIPADESRQRLAALLAHVSGRPDLVICLDGFPALLRAERGGSNKAILLSGLANARCQLVGLLTPRDYEEFVSDDPDFSEFFDRVDVEEPDADVALKILRHFARGLEQRYQVSIADEAVRQSVVLSANYILHDQLPAKALRILNAICEDIDYERSQLGQRRHQVTTEDVFRSVSALSGVPEETLAGIAERSDYEQSMREVIFGQDHAVREVATELGLIKAGMTDPTKPASVMLFLGQTGTGKTEMAKALARFYSSSKRLKTYTLGNCVEPHSVATIIGVPPGYVGTEQGGRLINELNADPYCVFLLDEADKAHPDVLQPFLNLFDEGWVSDQRGVRAYANKSIFILTTNVGQRMIAEMVQQGKTREEITTRMREALSQIRHSKSDRPVFTPEFLARIKRIIVFSPLDGIAMAGIARKLIAEMQEAWLTKRGKRLEIPEALIQYIAEQSHQINEQSKGREGGRIVRKLIAEWIEAAIQRETTREPGTYKASGVVRVEFEAPESPSKTEGIVPKITIQFQKE
jgi:ATP-dependent Clp protease ATP-binding subunit ClpA